MRARVPRLRRDCARHGEQVTPFVKPTNAPVASALALIAAIALPEGHW
jgi:hypothetical protein